MGSHDLDNAMYLNRLLHDTRRKAQSVLKNKQFMQQDSASNGGGNQQSPNPAAAKALDLTVSGNRANSMLD